MNYLSNRIVGNLLDRLRKLYMNGMVIQKFLAFLKLWKILASFCFHETDILQKTVVGCPRFSKMHIRRRMENRVHDIATRMPTHQCYNSLINGRLLKSIACNYCFPF